MSFCTLILSVISSNFAQNIGFILEYLIRTVSQVPPANYFERRNGISLLIAHFEHNSKRTRAQQLNCEELIIK